MQKSNKKQISITIIALIIVMLLLSGLIIWLKGILFQKKNESASTQNIGINNYEEIKTEINVEEKNIPSKENGEFEKYILGADGTGRVIMEVDDNENITAGIVDFSEFLDDPLTEEVNEKETLAVELLAMAQNEDTTKGYIYAKYDNKVYKIIVDLKTYKSELPLEIIYEPKGKEGQTTEEGWTIIYDKGKTLEAVSPDSIGDLRLGYTEEITDSETQLTQSIESYNSAIKIINDYCKTIKDLPTNNGVRSVGSSTETSNNKKNKYKSDNLELYNSIYNGVGKKGDILFEQDLVRMAYHGVLSTKTPYWIASRVVYEHSDSIDFHIYYVSYDLNNERLWLVRTSGDAYGRSESYSVRPIITIQNQ